MRRARIRHCAGAVAAAALATLTGCTGSFADTASGTSSAPATSSTTSVAAPASAAASTTAAVTSGGSSFCARAGALVSSSNRSSLDTTRPDAAAAFLSQAATRMRAIDAPSDIATDWSAVADGLGELASAYGKADLSTVSGENDLERAITQIQTRIGPAQNHVNAYLQQSCGVGVVGSAATSSNPAPVLVPSPHAP